MKYYPKQQQVYHFAYLLSIIDHSNQHYRNYFPIQYYSILFLYCQESILLTINYFLDFHYYFFLQSFCYYLYFLHPIFHYLLRFHHNIIDLINCFLNPLFCHLVNFINWLPNFFLNHLIMIDLNCYFSDHYRSYYRNPFNSDHFIKFIFYSDPENHFFSL